MKNELRVWWFPEWLPEEQVLENTMKQIIADEFQKYGFVNIETPAVERNDVLTAKSGNDVSQQIYWLYWLAQVQKGGEDYKDFSLRFDLTVPMSRYVLDHAEELAFPFKRYQIQKVRRGESHQKWRYKEFYQCDVDVIDEKVDIHYDAETIELLAKTLKKMFQKLWIEKEFTVQLNNRKIYDALFQELWFDESTIKEIMKAIDAYYKMKETEFDELLESIIWKQKAVLLKQYLTFGEWDSDDNMPAAVSNAKKELKTVYDLLIIKWIQVEVNPYIVRWLDYYNGTVFETFIDGYSEFWSVCSWGRYDNLSKYITDNTWHKGKNYEGVWGSIWLSRLLWRLINAWLINNKHRLVDVLFFNIQGQSLKYKEELVSLLREWWIKVDLYYKEDSLSKQFKYAEKKWIPIWVFIWDSEEKQQIASVRNLVTKENNQFHKEDIMILIKETLSRLD